MDKNILVSMLIVVRNAEDYILKSINSLINQGFEKDKYEIIIVDGLSDDNTINIAREYLNKKNINYKIIKNDKKILASGWNLGIKNAKGKYIVRPDAHAELFHNYVKIGIEKLEKNSSLAAVGGILKTKSFTYLGKMISKVLSNPIGVGSSLFRIGVKKDIYSNTVVYGVYRKKILEEIGFLDESLKRTQDLNLHLKILKKGYKLLTTPDMQAIYYNRASLKKFIYQAYNTGYWIIYGKTGHIRHMIPMFFTFVIIISIFFKKIQIILYPIYICVVVASYVFKSKEYNIFNLLILVLLTFALHISYGLGSIIGLIKRLYKFNSKFSYNIFMKLKK